MQGDIMGALWETLNSVKYGTARVSLGTVDEPIANFDTSKEHYNPSLYEVRGALVELLEHFNTINGTKYVVDFDEKGAGNNWVYSFLFNKKGDSSFEPEEAFQLEVKITPKKVLLISLKETGQEITVIISNNAKDLNELNRDLLMKILFNLLGGLSQDFTTRYY